MNKEKILELHRLSIQQFGGSMGIRDDGYLQSAIKRPYSTFASEELYPWQFQKAAAILESILKNHPFVDGNKRTGYLACIDIMLTHRWALRASEDDAYDFVIKVASTHMEFEAIVSWIEEHSQSI